MAAKIVTADIKLTSLEFETDNLKTIEPITIQIIYDEEGEQYLAYTTNPPLHGAGKTEKEAIRDLIDAIEDSYFMLKEEPSNLGAALQEEWHFYKKVLAAKDIDNKHKRLRKKDY